MGCRVVAGQCVLGWLDWCASRLGVMCLLSCGCAIGIREFALDPHTVCVCLGLNIYTWLLIGMGRAFTMFVLCGFLAFRFRREACCKQIGRRQIAARSSRWTPYRSAWIVPRILPTNGLIRETLCDKRMCVRRGHELRTLHGLERTRWLIKVAGCLMSGSGPGSLFQIVRVSTVLTLGIWHFCTFFRSWTPGTKHTIDCNAGQIGGWPLF